MNQVITTHIPASVTELEACKARQLYYFPRLGTQGECNLLPTHFIENTPVAALLRGKCLLLQLSVSLRDLQPGWSRDTLLCLPLVSLECYLRIKPTLFMGTILSLLPRGWLIMQSDYNEYSYSRSKLRNDRLL